jgi:AraC-like DNA-binding protein
MRRGCLAYRPIRTNLGLAGSAVQTRRCAPAADLACYLHEFWQYDVPPDRAYVPVQIYPSGVTLLRFDIDEVGVEAAVYGPSTSPRVRGLFFRGVHIFGVAFEAARAYQLLGLPISELKDLRVQLDVLWPRTLPELKERLWEARSFEARVALLSDFLRKAIRPQPLPQSFLHAFDALVVCGVDPDASRPITGARLSARSLRRQFTRFLGLGPKQTERIVRFQRLLAVVTQARPTNFAALAQRCGYSDQAHLIHEFTSFVGTPPARYMSCLPDLHDPRLALWGELHPDRGRVSEPPIRKLGA